jgi:hypothetical protein
MLAEGQLSNNDEIRIYIIELDTIIYQVSHYFDIWWICSEHDSRNNYIDIMNYYVMFFRTSINANFVALLIALYKMFEKNKQTINFRQLIKLLKTNCNFSKS